MTPRGKIVAIAIITILVFNSPFIPRFAAQAQPPLPQFPEWKFELYGPRIDTYLTRVITNKESRIAAYETGEIDELGGLEPSDVDRIRTNRPDSFFLLSQDYEIAALQFNLRRYPFSELAVRQAFAYIVDREGFILPEILKGLGLPVYTIVLPLYGVWHNPNLKPIEFDLRKAEEVLDKAGFVRGPDGFRIDPKTKDPLKPFELITRTEGERPFFFRTGQHIIKQAEKIGLRVTHTVVTATSYNQRIPNQDFDMYFNSWLLDTYPTFMATFWHTRNDYKLGTNRYGVHNPLVDELADKFIFASTEKEAQQQLWKLQEVLHGIVPWVPIYTPISVTAFSGKIRGLVVDSIPGQRYPLGLSGLYYVNVHSRDLEFGGTYRDVTGSEFANLNPMYNIFAHESTVINRILEPMTRPNPNDVYAERIPALAKSWKSEVITVEGKQQTKITVSFINNATWHDGVPFTAEDLDWTINVASNQWKTRRQYTDISATMSKFIKTNLVDRYTIEIFIADTSWVYLNQILGLRTMPKHIWAKMSKEDAQAIDPSLTPHPSVAGLTLFVGTGAFILKEHIPGNSVALQWNPAYYRRHPDKSLLLDAQFDGQKFLLNIKVSDYLKKSVTDAVVTVTVSTTEDKVIKETRATHTGGGTYSADVSPLDPGTYKAKVKAEKNLNPGVLSKVSEYTLTVPSPLMAYVPYAVAIVAVLIVAAVIVRMRGRKNRSTAPASPSTA